MKGGSTTSERANDSRADGIRSCLTTNRAAAVQPPTLRLMGVQPMTAAQQQRFEMLFDALIAHWLDRSDMKEGTDHGRSKTSQ